MPYIRSNRRYVVTELNETTEDVYVHGPFTSRLVAEHKKKQIENAKRIKPWDSVLEVMEIEIDENEDTPERRKGRSK